MATKESDIDKVSSLGREKGDLKEKEKEKKKRLDIFEM